jgi:hypothetical protein
MEGCAEPGEFKVLRYHPLLEALLYLFLEDNELFLHLWIDISFLIGWPKAPKCIADDVVSRSCLFNTEYIFSQLLEDVLPLHKLLLLLRHV